MTAPVVMWFRSDLRLADNTALTAALTNGSPILTVFVFDPLILNGRFAGAPRAAYLLKALASLDTVLKEHGGRLAVLQGDPLQVLPDFIEATGASALYVNCDYSPYALRRDTALQSIIAVPVYSFDDSLLVAPTDIAKKDGKPYTVYTPFRKQWLITPKATQAITQLRPDQLTPPPDSTPAIDRYTLRDLGFSPTIPVQNASENAAQKRLADFIAGRIYDYQIGRNRLAARRGDDAVPGTSFLFADMHFGLLSIREAYWVAEGARETAADADAEARQSADTWISELAWREFYQHILFHFPYVTQGNFRRVYDRLEWRNAPAELLAWHDGRTGYPVVDAAMRQLQQTGWMPNRARMIVASFLTKDLLIDWPEGAQHFMRWLVDGDLAANNGGWQWAAGTGTDAQPRFRIFNPVAQSKHYDADGVYIRRWVPELRSIPNDFIHAPWEMAQPPADYPPPVVDHRFARQRALDIFGKVKG